MSGASLVEVAEVLGQKSLSLTHKVSAQDRTRTARFMAGTRHEPCSREDVSSDRATTPHGVWMPLPRETGRPKAYRLTNKPMTMSCICVVFERLSLISSHRHLADFQCWRRDPAAHVEIIANHLKVRQHLTQIPGNGDFFYGIGQFTMLDPQSRRTT